MSHFILSNKLTLIIIFIIFPIFTFLFLKYFFQECNFKGMGQDMTCTCKGALISRKSDQFNIIFDDFYDGTYQHCMGLATDKKVPKWRGF